MRVHSRGIISYAGFDKAKLWLMAQQAFSQTEDRIPERFAAFLPLFPIELVQSMPYVGKADARHCHVSQAGFSIDPSQYHRMLYEEIPELYVGDNYSRNFDYEGRFVGRGVFTVDQAWATRFPQYQPFQGERLTLYMIGGGPQAVVVPESVYPRGRGVLHSAETDMRVTLRAEHYRVYVQQRVLEGEVYDGSRFEREYLAENELEPVVIHQSELGRIMQDLSILKSLKDEPDIVGLFTENAKRAEHIPQYAPWRVACDAFESAATTRNTARLLQVYYENDDFISDLWLPYQDAIAYLDRHDMTLNVRELCEGFQIPPRYDPETRGGRYPDQARVAIVRDRNIRPMVADAINNPAYGGGMSPLGLINKWALIRDSRELLRQKKMTLENESLRCTQTTVPSRDYRVMLEKAAAQERKGALIDAMYRRESALTQMKENDPSYQRAKAVLDQRVKLLESGIGGKSGGREQLSGYDADIDYLRRMEESREALEDEDKQQPLPFAPNALRVMSIESGYAMRSGVYRCRYEDIALPKEPEPELQEAEALPEVPRAAEIQPERKKGSVGEPEQVPGSVHEAEQAEGREAQEALEKPDAFEAGEASETPEECVNQEAPETSETSDMPDTPAAAEEPQAAEAPQVAEEPQVAEAPQAAEEEAIASEPERGIPAAKEPRKPLIHSMTELTGGGKKPLTSSQNPSGKMAELLKKNKR